MTSEVMAVPRIAGYGGPMANVATGRRDRIGPLLRAWRERRRMSQMELALEAGVSARHVSFVETGRSQPSADMLLRLADELDVPLRERNALLLAAGYAPAYGEHDLDEAELAPVRAAIQLVLDGHDPYPAAVVDRHWNLVAANRGLELLLAGVDPALLAPPVNVVRLSLHPDGVAPRIANLAQWREHLLARVRRQIAVTGDATLRALLAEVEGYPAPAPEPAEAGTRDAPHEAVLVPLRLRTGDGELAFLSTVATFGTAVDITVAELAIESFFPADEATATALHRHARRAAQPKTAGKPSR